MGMAMDKLTFGLAVLIYGISALYAIFLWRQGFSRDHWVGYGLLLAGCALHTTAMVLRGFSLHHCPINNLYEAVAFISWSIVGAYVVLGLWSRLRFVGAFASPVLLCLGVFALMPGLDVQAAKPVFSNWLRSMHATLVLVACGSFGLSAVAGAMFLVQAHDLKFNKLRAMAKLFPPLERLELVVNVTLITAFALLTLGIGTGVAFARESQKAPTRLDPFVIWTYAVWVFYLALMILHWKFGQRGRRFVKASIGGFVFIMLTFWGFYLLSPVHHP